MISLSGRMVLSALAVCLCAPGAAHAIDYYVDAAAGDDAGPGTAASPWRTLARLQADFVAGDTAHLSGTFRENLKVREASGCVIRQWEGHLPCVIRGDTPVAWSSWSMVEPGVFEHQIPDGTLDPITECVATVVIDWDSSIDQLGRHYGHLRRAASADGAGAGSDAWWLTPNGRGGGVLRIGIEGYYSSIEGLQELQIAYCRANVNGIELGTPTYNPYPAWGAYTGVDVRGAVVDGVRLYLWADSGARAHIDTVDGQGEVPGNPPGSRSIGYGVRIADGVGCTIRNVVTIDTGYHGLGFVGDACRDNVFENCAVWGGAPNLISGNSSYVFYSGPGLGSSDVTGCRGVRCWAYKYTFLGRDGRPLEPAAGCDGMIAHTNDESWSNLVSDVEWRECQVVESGDPLTGAGCEGSAFSGGGRSRDDVDELNGWSYPARFVDCRVVNGTANLTSFNGHVSFMNCRFDLRRAGLARAPGTGRLGATDGTSRMLLAGCEVVANLDRSDGAEMALFSCSWGNRLMLLNTSVLVVSGAGAAPSDKAIFIMSGAAHEPVIARGSVFGYSARSGVPHLKHRLLVGAPQAIGPPDAAPTNRYYYDFEDCAYFNLDEYGSTPAVNEAVEWHTGWGGIASNGSVIDPDGLWLDGVVAYEDLLGESLRPTDAFADSVKALAAHAETGFNGRAYDGRYGAWQFGAWALPVVVVQPRGVALHAGGLTEVRVAATGPGPLIYRWRRDGVELNDDGRVSGANTPVLTLRDSGMPDAGWYDVSVTGAGGVVTSDPALVRCPSDLDRNGWVNGDDADWFFANFDAGAAPADYDGNGWVNGDDFDAFSAAFAAGC